MELIVYAPVYGQSGLEQVSRNLLIEMDKIGVNIELRVANEWNNERIPLRPDIISRLRRMESTRVNPLAPHVIYQLPRRGQHIATEAPTLCYTLFETDRCPKPWLNVLSSMDKILVFSEFNRKSWSESGIDPAKISAIPQAVDSFLFNPNGPRLAIKNKKGFVFLCSGDFTERKNFESVIEAYVKEFKGADPVTLIFKCHYGGFTKKYRRECYKRLQTIVNNFNPENPPRILFYGDKISNFAMAALYRSVDCFVLTSRGEGLGMQYLEAMASGVPVIACDWGAQTDYLNGFNSYPVRSYLSIIDDPHYIQKCPEALNSQWCQVEIEDLRDAMSNVVNNYGMAKEKAALALKQVREMTWQKAAIAFVQEIINMYSKKEKTRRGASMKIMLVMFRTMGDVILMSTVCRELKKEYPDSEISFYTTEFYVPLLQNNPDIDEIHGLGHCISADMIFMDMASGKYDLIFAPYQVRGECNMWHQNEETRHQHLLDFYWNRMGMHRQIVDRECYLMPSEDNYRNALKHITMDVPRIAVHSTTGVKTKDWPYFNELVEEYRQAGYGCIQVGGKDDVKIEKTIDLREKMSMLELAAFLSKCALFIGLDSGVSYMADAMKVPTIVIQGSTDPITSGPISNRVLHAFAKETGYEDCQKIRCHVDCRHEVNCNTKISVQSILDLSEHTLTKWKAPVPVGV